MSLSKFPPGSSLESVLESCMAAPGLEGIETARLNRGPFFGRNALPRDLTGICETERKFTQEVTFQQEGESNKL